MSGSANAQDPANGPENAQDPVSGPENAQDLELEAGRLDRAAAAARLAAVRDPARPVYRTMGQALLGMGRPDAPAAFRHAAALDPADQDAVNGGRRAWIAGYLGQAVRTPGAPPGIVIYGPFRDTSGYSFMVRNFARSLLELGERIMLAGKLWGPELDPGQRDPVLDNLGSPVAARAAVHFELPDHVFPIPGLVNVNFTMTEMSRVPRSWVERARWHDLLVVPTEASREAWIGSGMDPARIRLCPLGADAPSVLAAVPPTPLTAPSGRPVAAFRHRFLNVSSSSSRKNLPGLLRAWAAATGPVDDAVLVLKLGKGEDAAALEGAFDALLRSCGLPRGAMAEIVLVTGKASDTEISSLFRACTHYLSLSHGEGWDLPMMQAGVLGLELVAPDHSSYRTYLAPDTAHLIPAPAVHVPWTTDIPTGWWQPDEAAAAAILRAIIAGTAPARRSPREDLLARFRWHDAAARLRAILNEAAARR